MYHTTSLSQHANIIIGYCMIVLSAQTLNYSGGLVDNMLTNQAKKVVGIIACWRMPTMLIFRSSVGILVSFKLITICAHCSIGIAFG